VNVETNLLGRRCRPKGSTPPYDQTTPDDYYLEVVGTALDALMLVDVRTGETSVVTFTSTEFEPELLTEQRS
jgi:hypothetical protein